MVLTVEPGLYFIPSLLEPYRDAHPAFNWSLLDALYPFGGIRIEDNVRVLPTGSENLTRNAFSTIASADNTP
jgi:Xaa-Pro dipeptidase